MLMSVKPAAAQIGQTTEHEVNARYNLSRGRSGDRRRRGRQRRSRSRGEEREGPKKTKPDAPKRGRILPKIKVRFTVAPDAVPGRPRLSHHHPARGQHRRADRHRPRSRSSASRPTTTRSPRPRRSALPATVCGAIEKAEDLDFFKFKVEAGTGLTFHVRSQRLLNRLHDMQIRVDPMITLENAAGVTLAASDNYYAGDPLLFHKFEQAGEYLLEIRDVRYQGNGDWTYSIEINNRPFVTQALPLAVKAGVETKLSLVGYNLPADPSTIADAAGRDARGHALGFAAGWRPTGQRIRRAGHWPDRPIARSSPHPPRAAAGTRRRDGRCREPRRDGPAVYDSRRRHRANRQPWRDPTAMRSRPRPGTSCRSKSWPAALSRGSILSFASSTTRGPRFPRPTTSTFNRVISADSSLENWSAPADGKYLVEIRDLHLRGGPQYTYAIQVTRAEPHFLLEADTDKTLLSPGIDSASSTFAACARTVSRETFSSASKGFRRASLRSPAKSSPTPTTVA